MEKPLDQLKITEMLHQRDREVADATPFCPSGQELAAFFHGSLSQASREAFEFHLTRCQYCRSRLGTVAHVLQQREAATVPNEVLMEAIRIGQPPSRRYAWRLPAAAAVATAAMAVLFIQIPAWIPGAGGPDTVPTVLPRPQRNIGEVSSSPAILTPVDGSRVRPGELQVRWTRVPGSLYYDIFVLDAAGFVVWEDRLTDTQLTIDETLPLVAGERYFVRVDAYLAEAKSVGSPHVSFTVAGVEP